MSLNGKRKQQDETSDQQKHIKRPIMRIVLFTTKDGSLVLLNQLVNHFFRLGVIFLVYNERITSEPTFVVNKTILIIGL